MFKAGSSSSPVVTFQGLDRFFADHPCAALCYSGGTDSAFLLHAAVSLGADVMPVFVRTAFCTDIEIEKARSLCSDEGLRLQVVTSDVLSDPAIRANGQDRCYHCKKRIFSEVRHLADASGYPEIADGTNASDSAEQRPGTRALAEMDVLSPLRECGITKDDVRRMSREEGLPTWNTPTNSCLATRVDTGVQLSHWILDLVEAAEEKVSDMGFSGFRVRTDGRVARLQIVASQHDEAMAKSDEIARELAPMFREIVIDETMRDG